MKEKNLCQIIELLPDYNERFVFAVLNLFFATVSTFGNTLIIVAVLKSTKLRGKPPTFFIVSLSLADVLVGIAVQPIFCIMLIDWSSTTCILEPYKLFIGFFMCSVSISSAMLVCLDRMTQICTPFWYDAHVSKGIAIASVVVSWISGGAIGYISAYNFPSKDLVVYGALFWISSAIMTAVYCAVKIYAVAKKQIKEISQFSFEKKKKVERERKLALSLICVLSTIIICWLPFAIANVSTVYLYTSTSWKTFFFIRLCTITLGYSNSTFNMFIFSLKNREVKKAIRNLFGIKKRERAYTNNEVSNISTCDSPPSYRGTPPRERTTTYGTLNKNADLEE